MAGNKCPVCKRPMGEPVAEETYKPFCSKRCADVDLARWLGEGYAIPAEEAAAPGPLPDDDES